MRHRWFMASCIVIILMGVAHGLASHVAPPPDYKDADWITMINLMNSYKIAAVSNRTMHEIERGFSTFFEMASVLIGVAGLLMARQPAAGRLAIVYTVGLGAMLVNSLLHWFFIPHSFLALALVLCAISLIPRRAPAGAASGAGTVS